MLSNFYAKDYLRYLSFCCDLTKAILYNTRSEMGFACNYTKEPSKKFTLLFHKNIGRRHQYLDCKGSEHTDY